MNNAMRLTEPPKVNTGMGISRSPDEVFAAFTDPDITKRFWIADSTGPLEPEATVTWNLNAADAQATVVVTEFEPGQRLVFDWGDPGDMNTVDVRFSPWRDDGCYVDVTEIGFSGDADALTAHAADSTGGFTMVLCSLKALLEHGIELRAVNDRLPN